MNQTIGAFEQANYELAACDPGQAHGQMVGVEINCPPHVTWINTQPSNCEGTGDGVIDPVGITGDFPLTVTFTLPDDSTCEVLDILHVEEDEEP